MTTRIDRDFLEVLRARVREMEAEAQMEARYSYTLIGFKHAQGKLVVLTQVGEELDNALAIMEGESK